MERFEQLFESWINGNRKQVREDYEKMTSGEKHNFSNWLERQHSQEWVDRSALFQMVIFIAFR